MKRKTSKGITLIALVIIIIVLLILAGVTISALSGDNGILTRAAEAKEKTVAAQKEEEKTLKDLGYYANNAEGVKTWDETQKVNVPQLSTGMTKIMFTDPTSSEKGRAVKEGESGFDENNWYSYTDKKWANAQTEDGSMWVWLPRFAYKIDSSTKTVDVKFLIGTTDDYYDGDQIKTAQRQKTKDQRIDTTADYTVHPAFTNETSIDFANGGWDKEISGIWVAKFEAGYASGNNDATVKESSVKYSQSDAWVANVEAGTSNSNGGAGLPARNWLDGQYGSTQTAIKYPVFQGITYSMNYININDAFNISRKLTESGNIYGLSARTDSHLMKNSEWGACSYLGKNQYGLGATNIKVNNISLESNGKRTETAGKTGVSSVYAVTGVTTENEDSGISVPTDKIGFGENMKNAGGNTAVESKYWSWNQLSGTGASTTGTIYGVYDMSGGIWERTAAYVPNSNGNLKNSGKSVAYDEKGNLKTEGTKYTMAYSDYNAETDNPEIKDEANSTTNIDIASKNNWIANTKIYGDGVRETSTQGIGSSSWYDDSSYFPALYNPFFTRGGYWHSGRNAGVFAFNRTNGNSNYNNGFRPALVVV